MMNIWYLLAGLISASAVLGHFIVGYKMYMKPVLNSDAGEVPVQVMRSLFHYMSVIQLVSTIVLFLGAFNVQNCFLAETGAVFVIGLSYLCFTLVQLIISITSGIKNGVLKLFQWIFWLLIGALTLIGVFLG